MNLKKARKPVLAITLLLAICLQAFPGFAVEVVLCRGMDGHIALENAVSGVCRDTPSDAQSQVTSNLASTSDQVLGGSHCGPCEDYPVSVLPVSQTVFANKYQTITRLSDITRPSWFLSSGDGANGAGLHHLPPAVLPSFNSVRTVILLV